MCVYRNNVVRDFCRPNCGTELIWNSSEDGQNVSERYTEDDSAVINFYSCPKCGTSVEVYDPTEEEKSDYTFWNN